MRFLYGIHRLERLETEGIYTILHQGRPGFWAYGSLRGRRLKGKGKGVLGARETREAHEEGGRETPARRPLFFSFLTSTRRMLKS